MTEPTRGATLRIESDWLVDDMGRHNCAGGTPESGYAHEPHCGLEPLMKVSELAALFDLLTELELPINRPDMLRQHIAKVKAQAAADALEGVMHEVDSDADAQLLAQRADQWRAQAAQAAST